MISLPDAHFLTNLILTLIAIYFFYVLPVQNLYKSAKIIDYKVRNFQITFSKEEMWALFSLTYPIYAIIIYLIFVYELSLLGV